VHENCDQVLKLDCWSRCKSVVKLRGKFWKWREWTTHSFVKRARARAETTTPLLRAQSGFFFSQFLGCGQTGDHSQEDVDKFGYWPGMKVKTFKNRSYFWLHCLEPNQDILWFFKKHLSKSG
jgi:hypothetical protein